MDEIETCVKLITHKIKRILFDKGYGDWVDVSYIRKEWEKFEPTSTIIINFYADFFASGELEKIKENIIEPFASSMKGKYLTSKPYNEFTINFRDKNIMTKDQLENVFKSMEGISKFDL